MNLKGAYNHTRPGFVPNEFNSLVLTENDGRVRGADELEQLRLDLAADLRQSVDEPYMTDTDVIQYDGNLYIVGGYIQHLMEET